MKILILGGSGMLGHRLWMALQPRHEVSVTVRGDRSPFPPVPEFPARLVRCRVDAQSPDDVARVLSDVRPELVINCIGLTKQKKDAVDPLLSIHLNALFPHRLALLCRTAGTRLIHVSTDCVFSGKRGGYRESDPSDAEDLYGRTKALGEVVDPHATTLRTSIIGHELYGRHGLLEWFLSQTGTIQGYRKAIFTGFTTHELALIIDRHVVANPGLSGLFHVSSSPISKFDLLQIVKQAYRKEVEIVPDEDFVCDRSLDSTRFRQATGYEPPSWPAMITEMSSHAAFYSQFRG